MSDANETPLLAIKNLDLVYRQDGRLFKALKGIDLQVEQGDRIGLVGESGCGKSTLLKAIIGVMSPNAQLTSGAIRLNGFDLVQAQEEKRTTIRWAEISMITQSALNALNPVHRVGEQIVEAIRAHEQCSVAQARARAEHLFDLVGVDQKRIDDYPHQFSGGMRQRVVIAMALALRPKLVLADEPTTALDVIVQDQIFERLIALQQEQAFALVLVTHDLALVVERCTRIAVMYAGEIVEAGDAKQITRRPMHPYTIGLRNAVSDIRAPLQTPISIPGSPPDLSQNEKGCLFAPRCPLRQAVCMEKAPELQAHSSTNDERLVRCHRLDDVEALRQTLKNQEAWQPLREQV